MRRVRRQRTANFRFQVIRVRLRESKGCGKDPGLVATHGMIRIQYIVEQFALLDDCVLKVWERRRRRAHRTSRFDPATRSNRNSLHSIGPFHIGTRRDSFRRIACGSLASGLSTQAVQPA